MDLNRLDYDLPETLIAQHAVEPRDSSRLMIIHREARQIEHRRFRDLPEYLSPLDTLVLNNTRVLPARLYGHRCKSGGKWEGLYVGTDPSGLSEFMAQTRGKPTPGERIRLSDSDVELELVEKNPSGHWLLRPCGAQTMEEILESFGSMPLPPYIRGGHGEPCDRSRYQTVYASQPGAIAAPTAGLHFTPELIERIQARHIEFVELTLHVGAGTFQPIREPLDKHIMHAEHGRVAPETVEVLNQRRHLGGRIVAVGTTSVRVLETAARGGQLSPWEGESRIFIRPPHEFRAVDAMITNFHLPRSTLLALMFAFMGESLTRKAYAIAVEERYRFYSYGDAMLVL